MINAESIICFCIILISSAPMIILGIIQYNSKKPVGFWAGKEPPGEEQVSDIRAYNHRHGIMWLLYGAGLILCFIPGFFFGENWGIALAVLVTAEISVGLIGMIYYHNYLDRTYLKEGDSKMK